MNKQLEGVASNIELHHFMVRSVTCIVVVLTLFRSVWLVTLMNNNFTIIITSRYLVFKCAY
jgi:hypothetical protein